MTAEEIHRVLDDHGLAPPVHYCALPHDWRTALEKIEEQMVEETNVSEYQHRIEKLEASIADAITTLEDA